MSKRAGEAYDAGQKSKAEIAAQEVVMKRSVVATRGIVEAGASSSVARRPGATSPVPEVTIKGRSEPASTAPRGEYIFAKIPMRRVRQG